MDNRSRQIVKPRIVELYINDLSMGAAALTSLPVLGRQIDGVWHTSVVVYGREHSYNCLGITINPPGNTILSTPLRTLRIGVTNRSFIDFEYYLSGLGGDSKAPFASSKYNIFSHNCNSFSENLCQYLCGASIPKYISDCPNEFLSTPWGYTLGPYVDNLIRGISWAASQEAEGRFV